MVRIAIQQIVPLLRCQFAGCRAQSAFISSSAWVRQAAEEQSTPEHYDVIIVGGGPAGLTMAAAIAKDPKLSDKRVLLLDGAPPFKGYSADGYSNRMFALNRGTVQLLQRIGAWPTITAIRHRPVRRMQVWDASSDATITFSGEQIAADMAYIVENDVLLHAVLEQLDEAAGGNVKVQTNSRIEAVQLAAASGTGCGLVQLKSGERFSCELLIGADGANSLVRRQMATDNYTEAYDQMGLIATVRLQQADEGNHTAWQRFLPDGVLAVLPVSAELSSIVLSTGRARVKELLAADEADFVGALNDSLFKEYPKNELISGAMRTIDQLFGGQQGIINDRQQPPQIGGVYGESRAAFPLGFAHSSTYVAPGTALIGDAAHRVHPLAGQGLNLGFGDVACLADKLAAAAYSGFALGNVAHLRDYERERLRHNVPVMFGVHALQKLYGTDFGPVVLARSVGLQLAHRLEPLKNMFSERAMG